MKLDLKNLNLDSEISLSKRSRKQVFPTKTTVNLLQKPDKRLARRKLLIRSLFALFVIAALVIIFVIRPLFTAVNLKMQVANAQAELTELESQNGEYQSVYEEYVHYATNFMTADESVLHDRADVLNIIKTRVLTESDINAVTLTGNALTLVINDISLTKIATIVSNLQSDDGVSYVTVATAATNSASGGVQATLTVTLENAGGEEAS